MNNQNIHVRLQSAQSYLSEAAEAIDDMVETLQNIDEEELSPANAGALSQLERAQALTASAISALDKVKIRPAD